LSKQSTSISGKFDLRSKQLQLLLFSVHQLEQILEDEKLEAQAAQNLRKEEGEKEMDIVDEMQIEPKDGGDVKGGGEEDVKEMAD
jgi:hypothetical protein